MAVTVLVRKIREVCSPKGSKVINKIVFMILADTCTRDTEHVSHYVGVNAFIFMEQCHLYFIS